MDRHSPSRPKAQSSRRQAGKPDATTTRARRTVELGDVVIEMDATQSVRPPGYWKIKVKDTKGNSHWLWRPNTDVDVYKKGKKLTGAQRSETQLSLDSVLHYKLTKYTGIGLRRLMRGVSVELGDVAIEMVKGYDPPGIITLKVKDSQNNYFYLWRPNNDAAQYKKGKYLGTAKCSDMSQYTINGTDYYLLESFETLTT